MWLQRITPLHSTISVTFSFQITDYIEALAFRWPQMKPSLSACKCVCHTTSLSKFLIAWSLFPTTWHNISIMRWHIGRYRLTWCWFNLQSVVNGLKEHIQPYRVLVVKLRTRFGPVIIGAGYLSCSVVLVAKILFFLGGLRGLLLCEYKTQVYEARTLEMWLLHYKWCIMSCPFTLAGSTQVYFFTLFLYNCCYYYFIKIIPHRILTGVKEQKVVFFCYFFKKALPCVRGLEVQMKWVSNENALRCAAVFSGCPNAQWTA